MIHVFISTASGPRVDYTRYVQEGTLQISDQLNLPTVCNFTLNNLDSAFRVPGVQYRVEVYSDKYNLFAFTGYLTQVPAVSYVGLNSKVPGGLFRQYTCVATSDEYILNNRPAFYLPTFANQTQGDILGILAETLEPDFLDTSSAVASGDIVPYYQFNPSQGFSSVAQSWGNSSNYRYKCINKQLQFQPYGDAPLGISYDETGPEGSFDPTALTTSLVTTPMVNDVTVIGLPEAGSYVKDYFIGDGFTANFVLTEPLFRADTNLMIQETWAEGSINTSLWTVQDPQNIFYPYQGQLNILGGSNSWGTEYLLCVVGLELGGQLLLYHGEIEFTAQSTGLIGGVYESSSTDIPDFLDPESCICGFMVSPSGASGTQIIPWVMGASGAGLSVGVILDNYHYILSTQISVPEQYRYIRNFRSLQGTAYGGQYIAASPATITFEVQAINLTQLLILSSEVPPSEIPPPVIPVVTSVSYTVSGLPEFALYAPFNSYNLNLAVNNTSVSQPPQCTLTHTPLVAFPGPLTQIIDLANSQVNMVAAASGSGGGPDYTLANRQGPYNYEVWEGFAPTAWNYMIYQFPSYLLTLPGQSSQFSVPGVPVPPNAFAAQTLQISGALVALNAISLGMTTGVSGGLFNQNAQLQWLIEMQRPDAQGGWQGQVGYVGAASSSASGALQPSGGVVVQGTLSYWWQIGIGANLPTTQIPFVNVGAPVGNSQSGNYGNLPSGAYRIDVYSMGVTGFTFLGTAETTLEVVGGQWQQDSAVLYNDIVAFVVPIGEPSPTVGQQVPNPALTYSSIADSLTTPNGTALLGFTGNCLRVINTEVMAASGLPVTQNPDGSWNISMNTPIAPSGTADVQLVYNGGLASGVIIYDGYTLNAELGGMVRSYQIPPSDVANNPATDPFADAPWMHQDAVAMGGLSLTNRARIYDQALGVLANIIGQNMSGAQAIATQLDNLIIGSVNGTQFLAAKVYEDFEEGNTANWEIVVSGSIVTPLSLEYTKDEPPFGSNVCNFASLGVSASTWGYVGTWNDPSPLIYWRQLVGEGNTLTVTVIIETTFGVSGALIFQYGFGGIEELDNLLFIPYSYPFNAWSAQPWNVGALWDGSNLAIEYGLFRYINSIRITGGGSSVGLGGEQVVLIDDIMTGTGFAPGALATSYDLFNGVVDESTLRTKDMSWVAYALAYYEWQSGDALTDTALPVIFAYLASLQFQNNPDDLRYGLLNTGYGQYFDPPPPASPTYQYTPGWLNTADTAANIMAYFAFVWGAYILNNPSITYLNQSTQQFVTQTLDEIASSISDALVANLWLPEGYFAQGITASGTVNTGVTLESAGTLGMLFAMAIGRFDLAQSIYSFLFSYQYGGQSLFTTGQTIAPSSEALTFNEAYEESTLIDGFLQFINDPTNQHPDSPTSIWSEGCWEAIAALSILYQSLNFPYQQTNVPLEQLTQGTPQQETVGFGQGTQTATIQGGLASSSVTTGPSLQPAQNQNPTTLSYYTDDIPVEGTLIELDYRSSRASMARVQDPVSIAQQAAVVGDNGSRGLILSNLSPTPRNSIECEDAAAAEIADASVPIYQGSYNAMDYFWNPLCGYPISGRFLNVNAPSRGICNRQFLVQQVNTTFVELQQEIASFNIQFGQFTYLNALLKNFIQPPNTLLPADTATPPPPQVLAELGSTYIGDLPNVKMVQLTSNAVQLDLGAVPVSGAEIRSSDLGWGLGPGNNLIITATTRLVTLPRLNRTYTYFIRQVYGTLTSRYTTEIGITAPLQPSPVGGSVDFNGQDQDNSTPTQPAVNLTLNGNTEDVYGVEIRAADNATVLYRAVYTSAGDLSFLYSNSSLSRVLEFYGYAFNLLNTYSDPTYIVGTLQQPATPNAYVSSITPSSFTVTIDTLANHPIQSVTILVSASGASGALGLGFNPPLQSVVTTGQPTAVTVNVPPGTTTYFIVSRNDYLGNSPWTAPILADLTGVSSLSNSENIVPPNAFSFSSAAPFAVSGGAFVDTVHNRAYIPPGGAIASYLTVDGTPGGIPRVTAGQDFTFEIAIGAVSGNNVQELLLFVVSASGATEFFNSVMFSGTSGKFIANAQYIYTNTGSSPSYGWILYFEPYTGAAPVYLEGYFVVRGRIATYPVAPASDGGSAGSVITPPVTPSGSGGGGAGGGSGGGGGKGKNTD